MGHQHKDTFLLVKLLEITDKLGYHSLLSFGFEWWLLYFLFNNLMEWTQRYLLIDETNADHRLRSYEFPHIGYELLSLMVTQINVINTKIPFISKTVKNESTQRYLFIGKTVEDYNQHKDTFLSVKLWKILINTKIAFY